LCPDSSEHSIRREAFHHTVLSHNAALKFIYSRVRLYPVAYTRFRL
jgi:hypothetical protein